MFQQEYAQEFMMFVVAPLVLIVFSVFRLLDLDKG